MMRVTLLALLAGLHALVSALPSGPKEDYVAAQHGSPDDKRAVGSTWLEPSCKNLV